MDGYSPAAVTIIEHVLPYLGPKEVAACRMLNKTWYALTTIQSARNVDCHIVRLPLRIAHYRRKGLSDAIRGMTVDVSFVEGYLSTPMYERRIRDAAAAVAELGPRVRQLKIHMAGTHSTLNNNEMHYGTMACMQLLQGLNGLVSLDLSECPVALLAGIKSANNLLPHGSRLRHLRWFKLGCNDMSSASALCRMVEANRHSLRTLDGYGDVTDRTLALLCDAPNLRRLDASGSSISDEALLELVRARGQDLRELVLSDCTRLTRRSIAQLTPHALPRLAVLDLYNVMVTTDTYQSLFNATTRWPYLRDLKLKAAIPHTSPRQDLLVNDDILVAIGSNCPRLVSLRLFGCHGITDDGLSAILGNLGYLRELVVMHNATDTNTDTSAAGSADANDAPPSTSSNGLLLNLPSISDFWANIPSLPTNASSSAGRNLPADHMLQQPAHSPAQMQLRSITDYSPPSTAPNSPCVSGNQQRQSTTSGTRVFTSQALRNGVRSKRFNLLNLDMEYDSVCAEHFASLTHLHVLCGRMITRHAKSLIESQFPKCKMMVWSID
ncbi:hypothetical protein GGI15_003828 [Coemansia interrupta]|uniref:RNI-like protein n=1 Tax=Coemansia interrupta TaxID=1126814 RepID=A0A9W8H6D3_9FUNG|nr:hypothetical protein GGI15_003828 [Coemansia interrupta]